MTESSNVVKVLGGLVPVVAATSVALLLGRAMRRRRAAPPRSLAARPGGLRILHLAYEDHRRPGSGGGSRRTLEMNRRLAARHRITVVTARYAGCRDRVEDGVLYRHAGLALGRLPSLLAYFAAVPFVLRKYPADLVVEDFGAPFGSIAVPLMTRTPTVGVVQWLFAREKAAEYHLPFHLVERLGLCSHRDLVAVSGDLAARIRTRNPAAHVSVVPNGVDLDCRDTAERPRSDLLFLGRMEIAQKGLDLLLDAYGRIAPDTSADLVVAGEGPDRAAVETLAARRGLGDRIRWLGRVDGRARTDALAGAAVLCMPSRYETFGMVAAEALACGTPVVAFDLPCLREVVAGDGGVLVPPYDVDAFAGAVLELLSDPERRRRMGSAGRLSSQRFDWDALARQQDAVYEEVARRPANPGRPAMLRDAVNCSWGLEAVRRRARRAGGGSAGAPEAPGDAVGGTAQP